MSLLTVMSHHHEYRSHNSITFHHSKVIERQLPAHSHDEVQYEKHGTRVTVRNLFGNLPVRVKQRAVVAEQKVEYDRLWEALKRDITALLLGWRRPISLRMRNADYKTVLNFTTQTPIASNVRRTLDTTKSRPGELQSILSTLTQANFISAEEWASWVPVSASTSNISIKGAISLEPAPNKRAQFISIGFRPLSADSSHNELYDEVNRVFSLSSFGTIEDDEDIDESEKIRQQNDKRFKSDGYTNRQLRGRKGVDRYPMFHLRISFQDQTSQAPEDRFLHKKSNLQAVVEILNAMLTQWLSVHHFRPQKRHPRTSRPKPTSASTTSSNRDGELPHPISSTESAHQQGMKGVILSASKSVTPEESCQIMRFPLAVSNVTDEKRWQRHLSDWSRIKSSNPQFYDSLGACGKQMLSKVSSRVPTASELEHTSISPTQELATFNTENISIDRLNPLDKPNDPSQKNLPLPGDHSDDNETNGDETFLWTDPSTKEMFLLNARTGCVMPRKLLSISSEPSRERPSTVNDSSKSVRLPKRARTAGEPTTPWLDELLRAWDNPIFKLAEKGIHRISFEDLDMVGLCYSQSSSLRSTGFGTEKTFNNLSVPSMSKLSKEALRHARIIAQLDKKFILVKMSLALARYSERQNKGELLVLIDQHAADERVRVESLLAELCAPLSNADGHSKYHSKLGHRSQVAFAILERPVQFSISIREQELFTTHVARFSAWGILYDILASNTSSMRSTNAGEEQPMLSVTTLPPSIAERCKADPKLLVSFLRSTVWKCAEDPHVPPLSDSTPFQPNEESTDETPHWIRCLSTCPQGLIDLVNSRACRSAIMFNDELSIQQCEELVTALSACVFPFMCAHGRPSMVPLVDLGEKEHGNGIGLGLDPNVNEERAEMGFINSWKRWKQK